MTPSWSQYTKIPPQSGGSSFFLIEKSPQTEIYDQKLQQDIIL
jgi:hypothetical protein